MKWNEQTKRMDTFTNMLPIVSFFDSITSTALPISIALLSVSALPGLPPIPDVLSLPTEKQLLPVAFKPERIE